MSMHAVASVLTPPPRSVDLVSLIRAEYREIPGLSVTLPQAARLWNADQRQCREALEALIDEGFLHRFREMYLRSM